MHFDDRLATVLRQRPASEVIARIQYRQLVDLLGSLPNDADGKLVAAGYTRLAELGSRVPAQMRARSLQEPGLRLRSPRLVAMLAESEPPVAAAAIAAARMGEDEWLDLIPALPVRARGILRHRRDLGERVEARLARLGVADRGLPLSRETTGQAIVHPQGEQPAPPAPEPTSGGREQIGAIVQRIEEFRRTREAAAEPPVAEGKTIPADPRLPFEEVADEQRLQQLQAFDFTTDAEGQIDWAEPAVAPMVVGLRPGGSTGNGASRAADRLNDAFDRRQPVSAGPVTIEGAPTVSGHWQIDAVPRFDPFTGRFTGYAGRARRLADQPAEAQPEHGEADRVRQILHELRTPVGAIQMSAEVIQQQLYGPTPHEYRALAAEIASDTARILAGFEEMERLAKLDSGVLEPEPGQSDLAEALSDAVARLRAHTDPRKSGFDLSLTESPLPVGLDRLELDRMIWRILAGLAGAAAPSEVLRAHCMETGGAAQVEIELPASLAGMDEAALFHAGADDRHRGLSAGMFGLGFTFRLARAEARAAGGSLLREGDALILSLPRLALPSVNLSQD